MKKNKIKKYSIYNDKVLILLIGLLAIVTAIFLSVLVANSTKLDPESDKVVTLHNYFSLDDSNDCESLFNYSNKLVEYNDIDEENRLCIAYQKAEIKDKETITKDLDKKKNTCTIEKGIVFKKEDNENKCSYSKIKKNVIDDSYKKLYGKDIENNESFKIDNKHICYLKDDYYYCGLSETFTYTIGSESLIYRVIEKAIEKSREITIFDYFIRINDGTCYQNYTTPTINKECDDNYTSKTNINFKFMKKYGTKYKHTYKQNDDGTYYWVSSEPIK